jgi:hypothetical protein
MKYILDVFHVIKTDVWFAKQILECTYSLNHALASHHVLQIIYKQKLPILSVRSVMNDLMVAKYVLNLNVLNARMDIIFNLIQIPVLLHAQIIIYLAINQFKELVSNAMRHILDVYNVIKLDA